MSRWLFASALVLSLFAARLAAAAGVPVDKASKDQLKAAQRTFEAADVLFDAKRYGEAITAYRASYEIVASPNSRLMIGRSLVALGRLDEAYAELLGAVDDAKAAAAADEKYQSTLQAAQTELTNLEAKVGHLEIALGAGLEGAKVSVGSRALAPSDLVGPIVVAPGKLTVTATTSDGRSTRREVEVAPGASAKVELTLERTPSAAVAPPPQAAPVTPSARASTSEPSSLRPLAYVAGGVGVAGLATFTVFALMNKSKYDDLQANCPGGHCGPSRQSDIDAGRRDQTIANIGLVVGVVGLGAGTTLFLLSTPSKEHGPEVGVRVGPGFAALTGSFQ